MARAFQQQLAETRWLRAGNQENVRLDTADDDTAAVTASIITQTSFGPFTPVVRVPIGNTGVITV